jgi:hypothetical protein
LHERDGKLTRFEKRLYEELVALHDKRAPGSVRKKPSSKLSATDIGHLRTIIGPNDDDDPPILQINCSKDDCPNKKYS